MMGPRQEAQAAMFYEFSLEDHVPDDQLLRSIDRFVDLGSIRAHLADFYSHTGRPSVDASLIRADANKQNSTPKEELDATRITPSSSTWKPRAPFAGRRPARRER